jgi:hypothetical protein
MYKVLTSYITCCMYGVEKISRWEDIFWGGNWIWDLGEIWMWEKNFGVCIKESTHKLIVCPRQTKVHGKHMSLSCVGEKKHTTKFFILCNCILEGEGSWEKYFNLFGVWKGGSTLSCVKEIRTLNSWVCRAFFRCMANKPFAMHFFFVVCLIKTHDKEVICRVLEIKWTAKVLAHDKAGFFGSVRWFGTMKFENLDWYKCKPHYSWRLLCRY